MTATLLILQSTEACLAYRWPKRSQAVLAEQAKTFRREMPPHVLATYDDLKTDRKKAVVGIREAKCGGCHKSQSTSALARLMEAEEICHCEFCGRFIYLATSRAGSRPARKGPRDEITSS